jgi:adhesin transport system outer membrane protein
MTLVSQFGKHLSLLAAAGSLSACMQSMPLLGKQHALADAETGAPASNFAQTDGEQQSEVIAALMARRSILAEGSAYAEVADAALAASARAAESERISAKLRAEAQSKNWLPTLGPSVSLTDLADLVAAILIEQVLFDNGRRKAEREFAAADVEVAAVNLSEDMNNRVDSGVGLYLAALRADEKAALNARALSRMHKFERIVIGRVEGGVSDRSDQRVVQSKLDGMRAARATAVEAAATARAELRALPGQDFGPSPALLDHGTPAEDARFLTILRAEAEATRTIARTKADRAGLLPQIAASGNVTSDGSGAGITLNTGTPLGLGTPAQMKALEHAQESARRQVAQVEEDARRSYARQIQRLASYRRQEAEAAQLVRASRETYRLFQAQFEAGQRSVMDVVAIYEDLVQREQDHVDAKYEVVLIQLALARDLGLLADGNKI